MIFIMSDDHARHALSCYGSRRVATPELDRLAKEGMRFDMAVGVNSLCGPSRAALITGKHSHVNGKRSNHDAFDGEQQMFPALLQEAGYQTAIVGKWHLKIEPKGFDFYKVMKGQGSYFNCEFRETGKGWIRERGYVTNVITESAIGWLAGRKSDEPFCLMVHHKAPHGPDIHEERHARLFEDETISEPDSIHDSWETRDPLRLGSCAETKLINISWKQDIYRELKAAAPKEKRARTSVIYQQMIKGYKRLMVSLDENVGRLLDYLDESGLRDNTVVIYTSDNGFFLGEHGLYNKMWMYEESLRLPLLTRFPGVAKPGSVNGDLVTMLDFAPTFLELAGAPIPEELQGRSFLPLLRGERPADWRTDAYYHFHGTSTIPEHFGIRTKEHKLLHFPNYGSGGYWEQFDLAEDPEELRNIYGNPLKREMTDQLREVLDRRRERVGLGPAEK